MWMQIIDGDQNKTMLAQFRFEQEWPTLTEYLGQVTGREWQQFQDYESLCSMLNSRPSVLVLAAITSKEDLFQVAKLIHHIARGPHQESIKIILVNFTDNIKFDRIIEKLDVHEVIGPEIPKRGFRFKMDFWLKTIDAQFKFRNHNNHSFSWSSEAEGPKGLRLVSSSPVMEIDVAPKEAAVACSIDKAGLILPCTLDDFFDGSFIFKLQGDELTVGDEVDFCVSGKYLELQVLIKASGVIEAIDSDSAEEVYVTIRMVNREVGEVEGLMNVYQKRQESITKFMHNARGVH
jgi:hypothetical protein